jgi:hypothetical protein
VLKERLGKMWLVNGKLKPRQMLPPRIPTCDWEHIDRYLTNGYTIQSPADNERRSPAEEEMISDLYSDAQTALMLADAKIQEQENTKAMLESGFGNVAGEMEKAISFVQPINNAPTTRAEAMKLWREMGRKVPAFNARLEALGVEDGQIVERWNEIIGE